MIESRNLTKRFVGRTAVDSLSFDIAKGEVVGFLGPNGAGKSTTMKMLTGYLPPSEGSVKIAGYDVFTQSLKARAQIGYMPENVPMYDDMRTVEYLTFRAKLKGVRGKNVKPAVDRVVEMCGLGDVRGKLIATLSKGYRQRTALADALVHRPALLILDEPTNGLDPIQTRQVRNLIRELGSEHTILLCTHLLSEVEMICRRVMIMHKGVKKADDSPENLILQLRSQGQLRVEVQTDAAEATASKLAELPGVRRAAVESQSNGWAAFALKLEETNAAADAEDPRAALCAAIAAQGLKMREFSLRGANLEDVFVDLTQRDA
jgi:ABC-2 type transport system ATP-binding protein